MAEDRSFELFRNYSAMEVGLDRLLLGISLAVCGYLGQTVEFGRIGMNVQTGNLLVMLTFVLSAAFGVRRLERTRDTAKANHSWIEMDRLAKQMRPNSPHLEEMKKDLRNVEARMNKLMDEAAFAYKARNACMFTGLLSYVALKVIAAY
ncbi:hypothetical protein [Pseudomonas solani]|uniref:hypothetical protein n=1 Tax=Pseudomonas solani TaxID=2731552 RepID=UPI003D6B894F